MVSCVMVPLHHDPSCFPRNISCHRTIVSKTWWPTSVEAQRVLWTWVYPVVTVHGASLCASLSLHSRSIVLYVTPTLMLDMIKCQINRTYSTCSITSVCTVESQSVAPNPFARAPGHYRAHPPSCNFHVGSGPVVVFKQVILQCNVLTRILQSYTVSAIKGVVEESEHTLLWPTPAIDHRPKGRVSYTEHALWVGRKAEV